MGLVRPTDATSASLTSHWLTPTYVGYTAYCSLHLVESRRATMTRQTSRSSIHVLISAAVLRLVSSRSWSIKVKDWPPCEARPCVGSHRTRLLAARVGCRTQCPAIRSLLILIFFSDSREISIEDLTPDPPLTWLARREARCFTACCTSLAAYVRPQ